MSVKANLETILARIARAAERSGRDPADVALCVVTKTVSLEKMKEAIACGIKIIGESRVNEAAEKQPQLGRSMQWHMVGHLQSRKAKQAVELFDMVQSVESLSTAEALEKRCAETGRAMRILIEVNTSQEEQKYGVAPDEAALLVRRISPMEHLRIEGLMTMAAFVPDPEMARPSFIRLRQVAEQLEQEQIPGANFKILSMGMSNDFEVAIEEGSTMVRIGTAIFEED
jgi:hypothetical protein